MQQRLQKEFVSVIQQLRGIKRVVTSEERQLKFIKVRVLSQFVALYPLTISN